MNKNLSPTQTIILASGIWCLWTPLAGLIYGIFCNGILYKILPALVLACYIYLISIGIKPIRYSLIIVIFCALFVVGIRLLGYFKDFTAYGESYPGPFEWINSDPISFIATFLLVGGVAWRLLLTRKNMMSNISLQSNTKDSVG
jgi:hypothetical protein